MTRQAAPAASLNRSFSALHPRITRTNREHMLFDQQFE
jgi:hypothetical protein